MSLFRIDMLPAREGDCLWIEYGDPKRPRRILVDGGRHSAYRTLKARFAALRPSERSFELLLLSHVDADHIEGLLKLVSDPDLRVRFKDVWFNGERHLYPGEDFGPGQGEAFTGGIQARGWKWNKAFKGKAVVVPDRGALPVKMLAGGIRLTVLSPTWPKLEKLAPVWARELRKAGLARQKAARDTDPPGLEGYGPPTLHEVEMAASSSFGGDPSEANGSSICVLVEFDGRKVVLAGDGHAEVLSQSLKRLRKNGRPIRLHAYKLSHHGSRGTHSVELMRQMRCKRFLVSTDGSRHKHPHLESIARTVKHSGGGIELRFNYEGEYTSPWNEDSLKAHYGYDVIYPCAGENGFLRTDV
jgi:hypothetical protein